MVLEERGRREEGQRRGYRYGWFFGVVSRAALEEQPEMPVWLWPPKAKGRRECFEVNANKCWLEPSGLYDYILTIVNRRSASRWSVRPSS